MFWRGVLGYLPVNLVQAIAGFGAIVAFTRLLTPADYGAYALALSVTSLVHTCLFTWVEAALARFYAAEQDEEGKAALFGTVYRTFAVMAGLIPVAAGLILAFAPMSAALKLAIAAGLASAVVRSLLKLAQERHRAAGEVKSFAVIDMLQTGGGFLIGVAFALMGLGAAAPLAGAGAACAVLLVWSLPGEIARARAGRFDRARMNSYAAYGLPLALSLVMALALQTTDRFVLAAFLDTQAVGAYHAGYSLSNRTLDVMFLWLGMAGQPACIAAFERGGREALHATARDQASLMLLIALPAAAGLALVAAPLAELMIGEGLAAAAGRVTPWIAAGGFFAGMTTHYLNTAFTLARRTRLLFAVIALPAAANLVLALVLIPRFGLDGAMWATTGSFVFGALVSWALARGDIALPIPWDALLRCGLATAVMALMVLQVPQLGGLLELALKASVGAVVYAVAAFALDAGGVRGQAQRLLARRRLEAAA
jgi:O-antigen/teichoic acid export membrane protein